MAAGDCTALAEGHAAGQPWPADNFVCEINKLMFFLIMHVTVAVRHIFLASTGCDSDNRDQVATLAARLTGFSGGVGRFRYCRCIRSITESDGPYHSDKIMPPHSTPPRGPSLALALALACAGTHAAPVPYATEHVVAADDTPAAIAAKAARTVPRPIQSAWMRL